MAWPLQSQPCQQIQEKKKILSCHSYSNLPANSYRNPHQNPQHLSGVTRSWCYQWMEKSRRCVRVLGHYLEQWWKWKLALELNVKADGSIGWALGRYGLLSGCQTPGSYLSQHSLASFMLGLSAFELLC